MVVAAFMFAGCDPLNSDKLYSEAGIAEDGLEISFREESIAEEPNPEGVEPELFLVMRTKKIMGCMNYKIIYELKEKVVEPFVYEILLKGVSLPGEICLTAIGPATAYIPFDDMPSNLELDFREGEFRDRAKIEVRTESVKVTPVVMSFTETDYLIYHRKLENSFYFSCGTLNSMKNLCQDFHELMISELSITEFTYPDGGYIPYPQSSSGKQYDHPSYYYTYTTEDEFKKAGDLLEQFTKEKIGDTLGNSLSIINWKDFGYQSWNFQ